MPRRPAVPPAPPRPRLDSIAKDAFRFLIPRQWTFQQIEPDYGLAGVVEIFGTSGEATGLRFRVQVTGTHADGPAGALSQRLPRERLEYYGSLQPPVLMVRYHARTGRFFARWALQHDPYEQERLHDAAGAVRAKAVAFRWAPSNAWNERSPARLQDDLRLMQELSDPGFSWPMRFTLHVHAGAESGRVKARLLAALRKQWRETSRYVALVDDDDNAHGSIFLSPRMIRATIGSFHEVTIQLKDRYLGIDKLHSMVAHVLVLVAIALTRAGHVEVAAQLCQLSFGRRG
jgi:Domain of unknown function (DUF4365)